MARDNREFVRFQKEFGNGRHLEVTIPAESQNLSAAEVDEMIEALDDLVDQMRIQALHAARTVGS